VRHIPIKDLLIDASHMSGPFTKNHQMSADNVIHQAFHQLGENGIRKFMIALIEHPTPDDRGWSDLTAFSDGLYTPIEVKGSDKLSFSQIERLFWLKRHLPEHAKNQRISHITLTR